MKGLNLLTVKSFGIKLPSVNETPPKNSSIKKNNIIDVNGVLTGTYTDDLNILELDKIILQKLSSEKDLFLPEFKIKCEEELYKIQNIVQTPVQRNCSIVKYKNIKKSIEELESNVKLNKYIQETKFLLDQYKSIGTFKEYIIFGNNIKIKTDTNNELNAKRLKIIDQYLNIVDKYITINISKVITYNTLCKVCGFDLKNIDTSDDDNIVCLNCGTEIVQLIKYQKIEIDTNKNDIITGQHRDNFYKRLQRYQGKKKSFKIPPNLIESLDQYFNSIGWSNNGDLNTELLRSPSNNGDRNNSVSRKKNKEALRNALKTLGYNNLYKDLNLILHKYWHWELPDLSHLELQIMEKYDKSQEVYDLIKGEDRSSSMNTSYRLWWLLNEVAYKCSASEFDLPKTEDILDYHEETRKQICQVLGWDFIELDLNDM